MIWHLLGTVNGAHVLIVVVLVMTLLLRRSER